MNAISYKCLRLMLLSQAGRDADKTVVRTVSLDGLPLTKPKREQAGISRSSVQAMTAGHQRHRFML